MGKNRRGHRSDKNRAHNTRDKQHPPDAEPGTADTAAGPPDLPPGLLDLLRKQRTARQQAPSEPTVRQLLAAEVAHRSRFGQASPAGARFAARDLSSQCQALDESVTHSVRALIAGGWTPADLDAFCERKGAPIASGHLLDVVAAVTAEHPALLVHRQWQAHLDGVGASAWWRPGRSPVAEWAARGGLAWPDARELLINLLALVAPLPRIETVLAPPGDPANARQQTGARTTDVDSKILSRVRALLAKAEGTEFPEEADALSAKAQQLITQYSIDQALADDRGAVAPTAQVRRLWLDNPYLTAKSLLVEAVARANTCRCVLSKDLGFSTLIGHDSDLRLVEMLTTSLLVQATRAMTAVGPRTTLGGASTTRSYRQSFLVSYASRIGERLSEAARESRAAANEASDGSLLPVLAARDRSVSNATAALFPTLRTTRVSTTNREGWGAGRAAADQARLDVRQAVPSR